jgi:arabinogalactan endo-1,4-beta-galactosidase
MFFFLCLPRALAQQPPEPVNINPIDGQAYYLLNQLSGMQADSGSASSAAGSAVMQQTRSFTSLTQRWAMTSLRGNLWLISNLANGLCLDASTSSGTTSTVQNSCSPSTATQQWSFTATSNGYVTVTNHGTGLALDLSGGANTAGTPLTQTTLSATPTQSQQWLLRPVFLRGVDNALLEKQEAERVSANLPWWQDAGTAGDVLQILKNHGINMIRIRPTSEPPYNTYTSTSCTGNGCYAETDSADIDLAKRAKQLGMSVELTLLFDGGSSKSIPSAWSSDTLSQAETDVYNYVKSEIEAYRKAGAMPDMVTIGNEVDTGFLGSLASPTSSNFGPFAAIQKSAMQAVLDASSDTSIGPPLPPPIRCIHITPAWDLTSFFDLVNSNGIPYDAICQSYYPMYHGPLTTAQATASNPSNQPVEETTLVNAANAIGKPIFIIETAEHYENGFDSNDPWYPPTRAGQRQFLIDLDSVLKNLPNHLGMGLEYWDPAGVNIPQPGGSGYVNGDGQSNAIFTWNGLTLFDNADSSGSTQTTASTYSALLPAADALGGKLDPTLSYKFVNVATGQVLETAATSTASGIALSTGPDTGAESLSQQWTITSNNDGYFQIANRNVASGATAQVLDNGGSSTQNSTIVANTFSSGDASQEWNVLTTGGGTYAIVNKASGLVLASTGASGSIEQQQPTASNSDWVTPASSSQQWKIIPVNITAAAAPAGLIFAGATPSQLTYGSALGAISVDVVDSTNSLVLSPAQSVTLSVSGPNGFSHTATATSSNGVATFDLSSVTLPFTGTYTLTASATGITNATLNLTAAPATLTVTANSATRAYGAANPAFTYTVSGFVHGDTTAVLSGTPSLATTASTTSAPGTYPITIATGTLSAANYIFTDANGTLTVTTAATTTGLTSNSTTVNPGQNVTLTATVTSATGPTPSGTVTFVSGSTTLGSGALDSSGAASLSTTLPAGANSIVAQYGGSTDFSSSTSAAVNVTEPSFTVKSVQSNLSLTAGSTVSDNLTITPVGGYKGAIAMSCNSTLSNVSCAFTPSTYTADGSNTALTGTVTLSASTTTAMLRPYDLHNPDRILMAGAFSFPGLLLLGILPRKSKALRTWRVGAFMLIILLTSTIALTACGGSSGGGGGTSPKSVTGTVTILATGSSGSISQSATLNLTVTQ